MGTGDYICITVRGGAPWGFRVQGGKDAMQPLQVSEIEEGGRACIAGLCKGDELVSINGEPCSDFSHSEATSITESLADSLQLLVKRSSSGLHELSDPGSEKAYFGETSACVGLESTTLQIWPSCKAPTPRELYFSESQDEAYYGETESDTDLSGGTRQGNPKFPGTDMEHLRERCTLEPPSRGRQKGEFHPGAVVEIQLSLSDHRHRDPQATAVSVMRGEKSSAFRGNQEEDGQDLESADSESNRQEPIRTIKTQSVQLSRVKRQVLGVDELVSSSSSYGQVEVTQEYSVWDQQLHQEGEEVVVGCRSESGLSGCDSQVEGGHIEAPPASVSFGVSSEGEEQGEEERDSESEKDHSRPNKHRARHSRLRRSESLSEKQVKEAKSKCKRIALLLTAAPYSSNKGVLMFKKHRQRAKKYTLVSYGTGESEPEEGEEGYDDAIEVTLLATSESELDEDFFTDASGRARIVSFDWDTGLLEIEKKLNDEEEMQYLPETKGKGALMFAKRRQRVDQITAEQEEMRRMGIPVEDHRDAGTQQSSGVTQSTSYQMQESSYSQSSMQTKSQMSQGYIDVNQQMKLQQQQQQNHGHPPGGTNVNGVNGRSEMVHHSSAYQKTESQKSNITNRIARPFTGVQNRVPAPFSPTRSMTSPMSDLPTPYYSSLSSQTQNKYSVVIPPVPVTTHSQVWSPTDSGEQIASRDERISVPAIRSGILQETRKRNSAKPMFTFIEPPKVSPNPELLHLLNKGDKRAPLAGFESGPEEDYLSLGAEACNFLQSSAVKQKTPPLVAPKPSIKPASPHWSPHPKVSNQAPSFPIQNAVPAPAPVKTVVAPQAPQSVASAHSYSSKTPPTTPVGNVMVMKDRGAELFASRQSRMEKFVVDSSTVQANKPRSQSPTPSVPCSWKYSPNIRATPPLSYNPTQPPSYPTGAIKNQPQSGPTGKTKTKGKKPTKVLNALDIMKHQPYQLNSSLFTYDPPTDAKAPLPKAAPASLKQPIKYDPLPPVKSAGQMNAAYSTPHQKPQVCRGPSYGLSPLSPAVQDGSFQLPANAYATPSYPLYTKQESSSLGSTMLRAPRPKFSAKKSGVAAQGVQWSHSLILPRTMSSPGYQHSSLCTTPVFLPANGLVERQSSLLDKNYKPPTPWEAAARNPLGLIDKAFTFQNIQESIAFNVISAAQRKTLPEPPAEWKERVSYVPPPKSGYSYLGQGTAPSPLKSAYSAPACTVQYGSPVKYSFSPQRSMTESSIQYKGSGSCYRMYDRSRSEPNYNM
ncbi:synaptopodin-2-like [Huso huso]|uniref:Synaptopodin-2-like n=1 Tax=Huso huso TaxID=61971 RepID=A0ABR1AA92_HUSHU